MPEDTPKSPQFTNQEQYQRPPVDTNYVRGITTMLFDSFAQTPQAADLELQKTIAGERHEAFLSDLEAGRVTREQYLEDLAKFDSVRAMGERTDMLTQLENPRSYEEYLERIFDVLKRFPNRRYALVISDLDNFGDVNKEGGQARGNRVLARAAGVIKAAARVIDRKFRIGGEEMAVVGEVANGGQDFKLEDNIAERIRKSLEDTDYTNLGLGRKVTASIGIALTEPGDTPDSLKEKAENAMAAAKKAGKNRVFFVQEKYQNGHIAVDTTNNGDRYYVRKEGEGKVKNIVVTKLENNQPEQKNA